MKKLRAVLFWLLGLLALTAGAYLLYVLAAYDRLEDGLSLPVENPRQEMLRPGEDYTLLSYNLGFGAYSADYSFFMDGGEFSRALSAEAVAENLSGALAEIGAQAPDLALLQEVDVDATRSYHTDETALVRDAMGDYAGVYAQNYDSPYLFWPLRSPHGKSVSGMLTQSRFRVDGAVRRSLPVEPGFSKFYDLDRCYSVSRLPVEGGKTLCLYNVHLSAYTTDGTIATQQLKLLIGDMAGEYAAGNYAVCGGDFNKDLLGDSPAVFGVSGEAFPWAQPFPEELLPEGLRLEAPLEEDAPVPSCRNADRPYDPAASFQLTVDGFLLSANVAAEGSRVVDTGFAWSDHNPVLLELRLLEEEPQKK